MMRALAIAAAAASILFAGSPAGADQTFWTLKTGPVPKAAAAPAAQNGLTLDYLYYSAAPCLRPDRSGRCLPPYPYIGPRFMPQGRPRGAGHARGALLYSRGYVPVRSSTVRVQEGRRFHS